jgi:uncharacterized membrane protein HdeD (DUF308 family)
VRGFLALAFGVVALAWPRLTLVILLVTFGAYAIADGIFTLGMAASSRDRERTWLGVIEGLVSIGAGLFVLIEPAMAARLAAVFIGLWAVVTGVMQLLESPRYHREMTNDMVLGVSGIVRVLLGVVLLARPHAGVTAVILLMALYAFVEGILMLGLAIGGTPRAPAMPHPA